MKVPAFNGIVAKVMMLVVVLQFRESESMLGLSPNVVHDIVSGVREHIFVDRRHIEPKANEPVCDSISGPKCGLNEMDVFAVIPAEFTGNGDINIDILHQLLPGQFWNFTLPEHVSLLPSSKLSLENLDENGRIASHYSMALPFGSAELHGRWLLDEYSVSIQTSLPAYIRFSSPVLIKELWAELFETDSQTGPCLVMVAFRYGSETVWSTEVIVDYFNTMDLTSLGADGHGPLRVCDEVVILSTVKGLKIVSVEFDYVQQETLIPALLLVPVHTGETVIVPRQIDAQTIQSRQVVSIREAMDAGYTMRKHEQRSPAIMALAPHLTVLDIMKAVKSGELKIPQQLRKAILKHEDEITNLSKEQSHKKAIVMDLLIAALLYL